MRQRNYSKGPNKERCAIMASKTLYWAGGKLCFNRYIYIFTELFAKLKITRIKYTRRLLSPQYKLEHQYIQRGYSEIYQMWTCFPASLKGCFLAGEPNSDRRFLSLYLFLKRRSHAFEELGEMWGWNQLAHQPLLSLSVERSDWKKIRFLLWLSSKHN